MNTPPLVDTRLADQLTRSGFFPTTVSIQQRTDAQDSTNAPVASWADVAGLAGIACAIARSRRPQSMETPTAGFIETLATHEITMPASYPQITTAMRVKQGAAAPFTFYDIIRAYVDSQNMTTSLTVKQVST